MGRAVHLNAWLNHRGFLSLNGPPGDNTGLGNIDWSSTKAYALGLNGLYLNRKGREQHGIVASGEQSGAIEANLREQLLAWCDPVSGRHVVNALYKVNPTAKSATGAPDFIVGYSPGYRASWQTGLGATPAEEIEDNNDVDW